jgi:hypothetical protein
MRLKLTFITIAFAALLASTPTTANAAIQKSGEEQLGKVWIGVHPIGGAAFFNGDDGAIYKFGFDVLGRIANAGKLTLWLGGELNLGGVANYALIEPGIVFQLSFERLLHIPLVPYVKTGFAGGIDVYYGGSDVCHDPNGNPFPCNHAASAGDFWFKFGGGIHYFLTRNIGLGIETNFALGGHIYDTGNGTGSYFRGYVDFLTGAVFTF